MYDSLFQPIQINSVTVPNRIVRAAHHVPLSLEALIGYHEARAKGGVGLSILGAASVHPDTPFEPVAVHDDRVIPFYEELTRRCDDHGMKVFQQLNHWGAAYAAPRPGIPLWSCSPIPNPRSGIVPRELTQAKIAEIVAAFAAAALRCKKGGLAGVELQGAHNYLINQFLSPATNQRTDEYGGSVDNRVRFVREIVAAIRQEVGTDYPVGVRIVGDDWIEGGARADGYAEVARLLEKEPIDFLDVSQGGYWAFQRMMPTLESPLASQMPASQVVTRAVSIPTIVTGRIMTLDVANHIVESGQADMVSMVRATIADADLVVKARRGDEARIRPCIGTNQGCVGGVASGQFGCVTNALVGQESSGLSEDSPAPVKKRVLVVGGGPAGMEAARVAAQRGHDVRLHELRRALGGQVVIAASVHERSDLAALTQWQESEMRRLGVKVVLRSFVDPDTVRDIAADEVILATGGYSEKSLPQTMAPTTPIPGHELPHVLSTWDVLDTKTPAALGARVVIFDDTANFEALTVALGAVQRCEKLTIICRSESPGSRMPWPAATTSAAREKLFAHDVQIRPLARLVSIDESQVTMASVDSGRTEQLEADTVILCLHHQPNRDLSDALQELGIEHHLIGDATGAQDLQRAVTEAHAVARAI